MVEFGYLPILWNKRWQLWSGRFHFCFRFTAWSQDFGPHGLENVSRFSYNFPFLFDYGTYQHTTFMMTYDNFFSLSRRIHFIFHLLHETRVPGHL